MGAGWHREPGPDESGREQRDQCGEDHKSTNHGQPISFMRCRIRPTIVPSRKCTHTRRSAQRRFVMTLLKRSTKLWLIRSLGALTLASAALAGIRGQALAYDDDNSNEVVTYGPSACTAIADLPAYGAATCVKQKIEVD